MSDKERAQTVLHVQSLGSFLTRAVLAGEGEVRPEVLELGHVMLQNIFQ